jgi:hypothetical protein
MQRTYSIAELEFNYTIINDVYHIGEKKYTLCQFHKICEKINKNFTYLRSVTYFKKVTGCTILCDIKLPRTSIAKEIEITVNHKGFIYNGTCYKTLQLLCASLKHKTDIKYNICPHYLFNARGCISDQCALSHKLNTAHVPDLIKKKPRMSTLLNSSDKFLENGLCLSAIGRENCNTYCKYSHKIKLKHWNKDVLHKIKQWY